ncbi:MULTISPECIES: NAD(P)/FAD-dependent oxidoreductase [Mesorhizobium]|uniref:NAD(P)/FAD-dependent oxidoreductase n=1 Tax=Mesorhizobium denitrificans TaxID=2294114 RepID=A0A371XIZ6_9HYPH|nr:MULTISPECIES: FAD/NAD(P)-binding oxidoreductase [Mesorhizobium]RFC69206.1 NAD(P)/FAD-dependent oxidoreductase [Mesorhizobium denitrificans]
MANGVVIVGTGHGGVQAAASLREDGYDGPVILLGDERELPYHKPPLSKTFIKDDKAEPQILRAESFYASHNIDLRLGERVERIDGKRLYLAGGSTLQFDHAILALGARPRTLSLPGAQLEGVMPLRDIADARRIREAAHGAEDVVVIGGGFIGLEIAATLHAGGRRVTVVEAQPRVLGRGVAAIIASHVHARLVETGVKVRTGIGIERIVGSNGRVTGVELRDGETIPASLVIVGIGVVPNVELAEATGLAVMNGIKVDGTMRTSRDDILAIGDCVNFHHWMTRSDVRLESVQNATDQARRAAKTIVGHSGEYDAVPWFWSDIGDMKLQMVGLVGREDRHVLAGSPNENRFAVFHFAGPHLTAIETINRPADHMIGRRILATDFSPDFDVLKASPDSLKAIFTEWQSKA